MAVKSLLALRIDQETSKRLERIARILDRPKSWIVRKGIENYLDELEDLEISMERLNDPHAEYVSFDEVKRKLRLD